MELKMIKSCTDCPNYSTCTGMCPELEKMLPPETRPTERPISEFLRKKKKGKRDEWEDVPHLDKIKKKKLGAYHWDSEGHESVWESVFPMFAGEWTQEDKKTFEQFIDKAIRYGQTTLIKRRFFAFLRCDNMTAIAKRANTSKQNIQQSFQRIVEKIAKKWEREDKPSTPLKFKSMLPEWK